MPTENFGYEVVGGSSLINSDDCCGVVASPAHDGLAQSISVYHFGTYWESRPSKCALYDMATGEVIANGETETIDGDNLGNKWYTYHFPTQPDVFAAKSYGICQLEADTFVMRYNSVAGTFIRDLGPHWPTWPSSPAEDTMSQISIFCTSEYTVTPPSSNLFVSGKLYSEFFNNAGWDILYNKNTVCMTGFSSNSFSNISIAPDRDNPTLLGQIVDAVNLPGAEGMVRIGSDVWVCCWGGNLIRRINNSILSAPVATGDYVQDAIYLAGAEHIAAKYYPALGWVAFVAAFSANYVTAVRLSTKTIIGHVEVGTMPICIRIDGNTLYVTCRTANLFYKVDITDPAAMIIISSVAANSPVEFVLDALYAYIACSGNSRLMIVDKATMSQVGLTDAHPEGKMANCHAVALAGNHCAVTGANADSVVLILVEPRTSPTYVDYVVSVADLDYPDDIFWHPAKQRLYVTARTPRKCTVVRSLIMESLYPGNKAAVIGRCKGSYARKKCVTKNNIFI